MRFPSRALAVVGLAAILVALGAVGLQAAETASSDVVVIREDVIVDDDLYASGLRVVIDGVVDGDLIAFAAEEVVINGEVTGSVTAVSQHVSAAGIIGESLRVTSSSLEVTGSVGKDIVAVSGRIDLGEDALIADDVLVWAFSARIESQVGGDLTGTFGSLEIEGSVTGEVDVTVSRLEVTGPLRVGGDLAYRSGRDATGLDNVDAGGVVVKKSPLPPNVRVRALNLLGQLLLILVLTAAAILVAMGWPERLVAASEAIVEKWARSYGLGLIVFLSPLLLLGIGVLIVAIAPASASLPLLAVVIPVSLALAGLVLALGLVAGAPVVLRVGWFLRRSAGIHGAILLGSALVGLLWLLPIAGLFVVAATLPLGLGGWVLAFRGHGREADESEV